MSDQVQQKLDEFAAITFETGVKTGKHLAKAEAILIMSEIIGILEEMV